MVTALKRFKQVRNMFKAIVFSLYFFIFSIITVSAAEKNHFSSGKAEILQSSNSSITLGFDGSDLSLEARDYEQGATDCFVIEGEGFTLQPGRPQLPAITRIVVVPYDKGLVLEVNAGEPRILDSENEPLIYRDEEGSAVFAEVLPELNGIYPEQVAEMSEPFLIRGTRLVRITTYPVRYNSVNNTYLRYDNIEAEIRYTNDEPVNPGYLPVRRNRSTEFMKFIRTFAINGDEVDRDDPDRDMEQEYVGHYLVVAREECIEYAEPFFEWRRKSGWKVDIFSVASNIAMNTNTIKGEIKDRWDAYIADGIDPFDQILIIGDHQRYDNLQPGAGWIIETDRGQSVWPSNCNHNDWWYACLDGGNDRYADAGLARWVSGSRQTMELFMHRTMSYEVTPYMEETEWFTRGGVHAEKWGGNYHVSLATNVRWAVHALEENGFDDVEAEESMDAVRAIGPFIRDQYNRGCNIIAGRSENYHWRNNVQGMQENVIYPIDINIAGHHEWTTWNMLRYDPGTMKGPVAASTGWGGQQTLPYSIIWLESVNGFIQHDLTWGWTHLKGVVGPEGYIPNFTGLYPQVKTDIVFYGDPGIQYWQGVPQIVEAEFPSQIMVADRLIEVFVSDPEQEEGEVEGARVTLYNPREMPDGDDEDYPDYDDMFMMTMETNSDGLARFVLPENADFEEGTLFVTINGRNILPILEEIEIVDPNSGIALFEWELEEVEGNEDRDVNPGEVFNLFITAENKDEDESANEVTATIVSMSQYLEIGGNGVIQIGDIDAGSTIRGDEGIEITVSQMCPDGNSRPITRPQVRVVFESGETSLETAFLLNPVAPNFVVKRVVGGNVIADGMSTIDIELENIGEMDSPAFSATIVSLGMGVNVVEPVSGYPAIASGRDSRLEGDDFRIAGNRIVVPGSVYDMVLVLQTEDGFVDSAFFFLQVGEIRESAPQGPDNYGYICFDDTDDDWDMAPNFEWIEISLEDDDRDFDGELLDFEGRSPHNIGEVLVVDLPFETQFYGRLYDKITVATNGFISMGEQDHATNFQNWPMDRCIGGGSGMLAPLWDDLNLAGDAGIYTYYDQENNFFIIEWHQLRHRSGGNRDLTFQVILYDHDIWITETGDQNILFQYLEVSNVAGRNDSWRTASPFASVGISSPDGNAGLNYSFNNIGPITSAPLANRRALLFSTSPRYKAGDLFGSVVQHPGGEPIANAIVTTQHGFTGITDEEGNWRIIDALAEIEFDITCIKQGFNDSTQYDLLVEEDGELEINFSLIHPEFSPTTYSLENVLVEGGETEMRFSVENTGNGPLDWTVERRLLGDANANPWEFRQSFHVGEDLEDARVQAVAFADNHFFIASGNNTEPIISRYNRNYELVEQISQPEAVQGDRKGFRDLAWDGELLWGAHRDRVYGINLEGEVIEEWESPFGYTSAITYDSDLDVIWVAYTTNNPVAYTRDGFRVDSLEINRQGLRIYGMAYWPDDPDNHPIYVFHRDQFSGLPLVHKFNTEGDTIRASFIDRVNGETPLGAFITNQYDVYSWVFLDVKDIGDVDGGDQMEIWQLAARREWFQLDLIANEGRVEADSGRLETGEVNEFVMMLNATGLPDTLFQSELLFRHNADSGRGHIMIDLNVVGDPFPQPFNLLSPANEDTVEAYNVIFEWEESIDPNPEDEVTYRLSIDVNDQIVSFDADSTIIEIDFENLEIDIDWMFENISSWWVEAISGVDTTESIQHFTFGFLEMDRPPRAPLLTFPPDDEVLVSLEVNFVWTRSIDPNPDDEVSYELNVVADGDTSGFAVVDTFSTMNFDTLGFDLVWMVNNDVNWWIEAFSGEDAVRSETGNFRFDAIVSIDMRELIPIEFKISSIYPNPFNSSTTIRFGIDKSMHTTLEIFDLAGRRVATLFSGTPKVAWHTMVWNGNRFPSGLYFVKLQTQNRVSIMKMTLVR